MIVLPYPPSANRIWRNVQGRTLKSREYRAWLTAAGYEVMKQKPQVVTGQYHLRIIADRPDRRARDVDNLLKVVSDALMSYGIIADDSNALSVFAAWAGPDPVKTPVVRVSVDAA